MGGKSEQGEKYERRSSSRGQPDLLFTGERRDAQYNVTVMQNDGSASVVQGDHVGFNTGNGEKLSYSQAETG